MTPHVPADEPPVIPLPPLPVPAGAQWSPSAKRKRGWWALWLVAAVLLAGGASAGWWWLHPRAPVVPPLPGDIQDANVRQTIERARQKVLDKPNDALAWGYLGMTLEIYLYETEADRCFARAARLDPADIRWPYFRGMYALKNDPEHALPFLRLAASKHALPEEETAVRLRLAEALLERHELEEAEALYREEWRRQPGNPRSAFGLGLIAQARGEEEAAAKLFIAALSSPTARSAATAQLAALARSRGDEAAAANYDKEAGPRPGDSLVWPDPLVQEIVSFQVAADNALKDAAQLEQDRNFAAAAQLYLSQIAKDPTADAYIGAGRNLLRIGDYGRAVTVLREGVRLYPDSAQTHYTLSVTLFTRAEKEWQRSPGSPDAKAWFRECIEQAQKTAELKPDLARNYLHWGLALKYLGEPAAAVAPLRIGVTCRPVDVDLQLAFGEALLEIGQDQKAETHLENAQKLDPKDARVILALERLHKKKER